MNMFNIELIEKASEDMVKKAIEMDHAAFRESDWITESDAALVYSQDDCFIWLTEDGEPTGFATILPLNERLPAESVKKHKPIYKLLTRAAFAEASVLYCHCFLLLPSYRGQGLVYQLYAGLGEWLTKNGGGYSQVFADAVSAEGCRCLERLGFTPASSFGREGTLYQADKTGVMEAIERQIRTSAKRCVMDH